MAVGAEKPCFGRFFMYGHLMVKASWTKAIKDIFAPFNREREHIVVVYIKKDGDKEEFISDLLGIGCKDFVSFNPDFIVSFAAEFKIKNFFLVHNHPSDDTRPSLADLRSTRSIQGLAAKEGLIFHDHIVVGSGLEKFESILDSGRVGMVGY